MRYSRRLERVESRLPAPRESHVSWLMSLPEDDRLMLLQAMFLVVRLEEAGLGMSSEEFARECQSHESRVMAICRLCNVDVGRVTPLLWEWGHRRG